MGRGGQDGEMEVRQGELLKIWGLPRAAEAGAAAFNGWTLPALLSHAAFLEYPLWKPKLHSPLCSQHFSYEMAVAARVCWVAWKPAKLFRKQL